MPKKRYTHIGGQAVIEGVMMRGKRHWTVTVRRPDGELVSETNDITPWHVRAPFLKWPVFRGVLALWEALSLAMKALSFSASQAGGEEVEPTKGEIGLSLLLGVGLAVGLFIVLPAVATNQLVSWIGKGVTWNIVDGLIRIMVFFIYLVVIGFMPDIRRVFQYHGAEHKTIHAFEHGVPLETKQIEAFSTSHVRCGTSFLLVVMVLAIAVFSFITSPYVIVRILARIVLIPVIAGLSYEVTRFAGNHDDVWLVRVIMWPGLALQSMTTREPSADQIEVAVNSLKNVLAAESDDAASGAPASGFPDGEEIT